MLKVRNEDLQKQKREESVSPEVREGFIKITWTPELVGGDQMDLLVCIVVRARECGVGKEEAPAGLRDREETSRLETECEWL